MNEFIPDHIKIIIANEPDEFISLTNNYYEKLNQLNSLKKELRKYEYNVEVLHNKMQETCRHEWEMDTPQYQTPTSYTCKICGAYK